MVAEWYLMVPINVQTPCGYLSRLQKDGGSPAPIDVHQKFVQQGSDENASGELGSSVSRGDPSEAKLEKVCDEFHACQGPTHTWGS